MTSEATGREITKWKLWGVNKVLELNAPLVLSNGEEASLQHALSDPAFENVTRSQADELLKEARSSLKDMDMKFVIYGALTYHNNYFPQKLVNGDKKTPLTTNDIFGTFGKKENQGRRLFNEAEQDIIRFYRIRSICLMPPLEFAEKFVPEQLLTHPIPKPDSADVQSDGIDEEHRTFQISLRTSPQLLQFEPKSAKALFELVKHTSQPDYKQSKMGWDDQRKIEEMQDADMRYLIVRLKGGEPPKSEEQWNNNDKTDQSIIGFLSFMITREEEEDVVYIYEVHISEHFRRHGIGKHLFNIVEHIGTATGMEKTMLTVFKCNENARKWYATRGYEVDDISPRPRKLRGGRSIEADYEILSKRLSSNKKARR